MNEHLARLIQDYGKEGVAKGLEEAARRAAEWSRADGRCRHLWVSEKCPIGAQRTAETVMQFG